MHMHESLYGKINGDSGEKRLFGDIPDIFALLYDLVGVRIHGRYLKYYKVDTFEIK